jgi:hypothetical protein
MAFFNVDVFMPAFVMPASKAHLSQADLIEWPV